MRLLKVATFSASLSLLFATTNQASSLLTPASKPAPATFLAAAVLLVFLICSRSGGLKR